MAKNLNQNERLISLIVRLGRQYLCEMQRIRSTPNHITAAHTGSNAAFGLTNSSGPLCSAARVPPSDPRLLFLLNPPTPLFSKTTPGSRSGRFAFF